MQQSRKILLILIAMTIAALAIRLYHLDWQCYMVDERVTAQAANISSASIIHWSLGGDYNPPTYYLLAHWSSMIFGEITEYSLRFPAAIIGALFIPVAYLLGKELRNENLGLIFAGFCITSFPLVIYSQYARPYTLVMLMFSLYIIQFIRVWRGDLSRYTIFMGAILAACTLWSHFYSLFPILISLALLLAKYHWSKQVRTAVALVVIICLPFVSYIPTVISHFYSMATIDGKDQFWSTPDQLVTRIPNELFCWAWLMIIPLALYSLYKYRDSTQIALVLIALGAAISTIPMTLLTTMPPRYILLVAPIVTVVALCPIAEYIDSQMSIERKVAIAIIVLYVLAMFSYGSFVSWFTFNLCPYSMYPREVIHLYLYYH
jgi:mannosyltransferase